MIKRILSAISAVVIALAMVAGAMVSLQPVSAEQTTPASVVVAKGATSYTTTLTSTSRYMANYTLLSYGGKLVAADASTVTAKLQVSPDNIVWFDYKVLHNAVVNTTDILTPTRTDAVFGWERVIYTPVGTAAYTPTLYLYFK